ncbi:MAG: hypothetical protein AABY22_17875 [Nanoarchaeota archaeon]
MKRFSSFKINEIILVLKENTILFSGKKKEKFLNTDAMELTGNIKYSLKNKDILFLEGSFDAHETWWIPVKISDLVRIKTNWFEHGGKFPAPKSFSLWQNNCSYFGEDRFWNK